MSAEASRATAAAGQPRHAAPARDRLLLLLLRQSALSRATPAHGELATAEATGRDTMTYAWLRAGWRAVATVLMV